MYLENSQNFEVTGNIFTSTGTPAPCNCNSFGVIVRNVGNLTQEIYRNDFTGFYIGIQAIGQNRDYNNYAGLQIRCNRFYNTHYHDISVVKDPNLHSIIKQGIKQQQGATYYYYSNTSLAGNIFTPNKWYYNNAEPFGYFHHNITSHPNLTPSYYSTSKITLYQKNYNYQYDVSCPVRQIGRSTQILLSEMEEGISGQEKSEIQLLEMTDAGNTQLMMQQVEMANEADTYNTYMHLLKTSPWLSEDVLVAVASRDEGFTDAMIRDILVANPQSAKSDKVMKALENMSEPLPGFMMAQIEGGVNQLGEKELLESEMMFFQEMHDRALNKLVSNTMHNTADMINIESLKDILAQVDDIRYQYLLAEILFSERDYTGGMQQIESIENSFQFDDKNAWNNHQMYISFYTLLQTWDNEEHPGLSNLPTDVLADLESYVNTGHRTSGKALSILIQNGAIEYKEPIYYPEEEMDRKTVQALPPQVLSTEDASDGLNFRVFPNPGRDYITFEWCTEAELASSRIEIYNASGVMLQSLDVAEPCNQKLFSLENMQSGNYVAKFISGLTTKNISFVVSK